MKGHFYFLLIALLCGELLVSLRINAHRTSPSSRLELLIGLKAKRERVLKRTALEETMPHTQHEAVAFYPLLGEE